jgi:cell division GTPase FtsZ
MLVDRRFYIGNNPVKGVPSISPKKGKLLILTSGESLRPILKGYRFIIMLTVLGGGTGTGATLEFAIILKGLYSRSEIVGLVTLGFNKKE